jgi:hypothetical protein
VEVEKKRGLRGAKAEDMADAGTSGVGAEPDRLQGLGSYRLSNTIYGPMLAEASLDFSWWTRRPWSMLVDVGVACYGHGDGNDVVVGWSTIQYSKTRHDDHGEIRHDDEIRHNRRLV